MLVVWKILHQREFTTRILTHMVQFGNFSYAFKIFQSCKLDHKMARLCNWNQPPPNPHLSWDSEFYRSLNLVGILGVSKGCLDGIWRVSDMFGGHKIFMDPAINFFLTKIFVAQNFLTVSLF